MGFMIRRRLHFGGVSGIASPPADAATKLRAALLGFRGSLVTHPINLVKRSWKKSRPAVASANRSIWSTGTLHKLRASLLHLCKPMADDPVDYSKSRMRTRKVLILHRCGLPITEIADHLDLPHGDVDLMVHMAAIRAMSVE